jgi:hypothetical protein
MALSPSRNPSSSQTAIDGYRKRSTRPTGYNSLVSAIVRNSASVIRRGSWSHLCAPSDYALLPLRPVQSPHQSHRCTSLADRHCSTFGAWHDRPQLGFCHGLQSHLRTNCPYNDPFPNSRQREANAIPGRFGLGGGGQKFVGPWRSLY